MATSTSKFRRAVIAGVGLMGGSLGQALKSRELAEEVVGWGRNQGRLDEAVGRGAVDIGTRDRVRALDGADLLVFATPGSVTLSLAREWMPELPAGCLVTDLVSVKGKLVETLTKLTPPRASYVSSHPLCGSDRTGVAAARPDLYRNQLCLLTPVPATRKTAIGRIQKLWQNLGMTVVALAPGRHDRVVAAVSHLPHLVAAALVNRIGEERLLRFGGTGLKDTTRIAGADPGLWAEIMGENRKEILAQLDEFIKTLVSARKRLDSNHRAEIGQWLRQAAVRRKKLAP